MNATLGGANLHPGVNLHPGANLHLVQIVHMNTALTASDCDGGSTDDERTPTASKGHEAS